MASIHDRLGELPSGTPRAISDDQVTKILRECYIFNQSEINRRKKMRARIELYNDASQSQTMRMIDQLFKNAKVRSWRKQFAQLAGFQNLTRRIIREISTVYSESATRTVKSVPMNERYRSLQRETATDRKFRVANQMVNLCNEAVLWFDVATGDPVIRIVTPDNFWAVSAANDPTELVALIFDQTPGLAIECTTELKSGDTPAYLVVTNDESFQLNSSGQMVAGSRKAHGLSRMPMILVHRVEPTVRLLNPDPGTDIENAHRALTLINVMFLKHQKSGTKQAVASGDAGEMPTDQPMDEEHILMVPEGVNVTTLDLGADPDGYIKATRNIIKQIASNWGIPESVFDLSYQASSGFEIELKRTSLKEIRNDQIVDWRPVEQEFAEIQEEVLSESGHELAFNTLGWSINFGETDSPEEPNAKLEYWKNLKSQGLMNQIQMYQQLNPEASAEEAVAHIEANININAVFVEKLRALNMPALANMERPGEAGEDPTEDEEPEAESAGAA